MIAGALTLAMSTSRVEKFTWDCAKILAVFFIGGIFLAIALDIILLAIAIIADQFGYHNRVGNKAWHTVSEALLPMFAILYVAITSISAQFLSAALAVLSFVVFKRVSLWWILATVPLIAFSYGNSFFVELYWENAPVRITTSTMPYYLTLCVFQAVVSVGCWWMSQKIARPSNSSAEQLASGKTI